MIWKAFGMSVWARKTRETLAAALPPRGAAPHASECRTRALTLDDESFMRVPAVLRVASAP